MSCCGYEGLRLGARSALPVRRIAVGRRWPLMIYSSALVFAVAGSLSVVLFPGLLPRASELYVTASNAHPSTVGGFQLGLALLYILAALGFMRRNRLTNDE